MEAITIFKNGKPSISIRAIIAKGSVVYVHDILWCLPQLYTFFLHDYNIHENSYVYLFI